MPRCPAGPGIRRLVPQDRDPVSGAPAEPAKRPRRTRHRARISPAPIPGSSKQGPSARRVHPVSDRARSAMPRARAEACRSMDRSHDREMSAGIVFPFLSRAPQPPHRQGAISVPATTKAGWGHRRDAQVRCHAPCELTSEPLARSLHRKHKQPHDRQPATNWPAPPAPEHPSIHVRHPRSRSRSR